MCRICHRQEKKKKNLAGDGQVFCEALFLSVFLSIPSLSLLALVPAEAQSTSSSAFTNGIEVLGKFFRAGIGNRSILFLQNKHLTCFSSCYTETIINK